LTESAQGIQGDQVLFRQIKEQSDAAIDSYAIAQALPGASTVSNTGATFAFGTTTGGSGGFLADIVKSKAKLTDTAGVRLRATHLHAASDFVDFLQSWCDTTGRPVFPPALDDHRLPLRDANDDDAQGYSGYVLSGLALSGDDNIPPSCSNLQIIISRPETSLLGESAPMMVVSPEGAAGNLEAILSWRVYTATIALPGRRGRAERCLLCREPVIRPARSPKARCAAPSE
jgi:hypothetical protein